MLNYAERKRNKNIYRGQTAFYPPPLRPSVFRVCQHSRFAMEGNPELQMRNWGREFYLEHSDCEYLFGNEQRKRSHAIRRIMSVYLNSALGYPLTQALKQQAGYSSEGLDVSYDYSTFFALHEFKNGEYTRKEAGNVPSVVYRWKVLAESFSLQDNYYCKAHFIPSLDIIKSFGVCNNREESINSLDRYLEEIQWEVSISDYLTDIRLR